MNLEFYSYFIVTAEQLFDMELTDYTDFMRVKRDFEHLKQVE